MKTKDLIIGDWYKINYQRDGYSYLGKAMFKMKNPPNYAENTLEFVCDDGVMGYFDISNVKEKCSPPDNLSEIIFKLAAR